MVHVPSRIAGLIAGFMEDRLTAEETGELTGWLNASDENMQMFELLTEERNTAWAKRWFARAGLGKDYFKGKKFEGWYRPEPKDLRWFYWLLALGFLGLAWVYLVLKFLPG